jgi:hypothetical protein
MRQLGYKQAADQAQGTAYQILAYTYVGNDATKRVVGYSDAIRPISTTYVKHFTARGMGSHSRLLCHICQNTSLVTSTQPLQSTKLVSSSQAATSTQEQYTCTE